MELPSAMLYGCLLSMAVSDEQAVRELRTVGKLIE